MANYYSPQPQPNDHRNWHNGDVLGNEGRKALDACVKVKIYGKPETRRYDFNKALNRLQGCYGNQSIGCFSCLREHEVSTEFKGKWIEETTFNIIDIHDVLGKCDEMTYVEKYPKEGPGSEKTRELIDKRRADVEREYEEATANPDSDDSLERYSWTVAQRRVRDCYAGNFPWDVRTLKTCSLGNMCSVKDIHHSVDYYDAQSLETCSHSKKSMYEQTSAHRASVEKEYREAVTSTGTLRKYTEEEAKKRLKDCCCGEDRPLYLDIMSDHSSVSIFDIHRFLCSFDNRMQQPHKYPEEGPGSEELKKLIDRNRADLETEYQNFVKGDKCKLPVRKYSQSEAERRVRDCFAGSFSGDTDMFPQKKDRSGLPKIYQTFNIYDIKQSVDYFDVKKLQEKYPEKGDKCYVNKEDVDGQRASIQSEYEIATTNVEIEHGSGFIIHDHFILTNKHVIQTYLDKEDSYEVRISNASIKGELSCKVAQCDPGKDLALLYCPDLKLQESGICPLKFSIQPLLPGMQIFSFGYPMSHTEETALFINGNVSGSKTLYCHSLAVLNCSLNAGNSGGPVLSWVNGQLKVVGIATQKHFKEILTLEERMAIEKIRKSLQACVISDVLNLYYSDAHHRRAMDLLTLKLYDALETHSQFNLSNALPGHFVVEFIKNAITEYRGERKEELAEIVKLSQ